MTLTILTITASVVSLVSGLLGIFRHRQEIVAAVAVVITSGLAITVAVNYKQLADGDEEIQRILDLLWQIERFNKAHARDDVDFLANGELKGIVMTGMQILERFQNDFPESYQTAKQMFYGEHEVIKDKEFQMDRDSLEYAAGAMHLSDARPVCHKHRPTRASSGRKIASLTPTSCRRT